MRLKQQTGIRETTLWTENQAMASTLGKTGGFIKGISKMTIAKGTESSSVETSAYTKANGKKGPRYNLVQLIRN